MNAALPLALLLCLVAVPNSATGQEPGPGAREAPQEFPVTGVYGTVVGPGGVPVTEGRATLVADDVVLSGPEPIRVRRGNGTYSVELQDPGGRSRSGYVAVRVEAPGFATRASYVPTHAPRGAAEVNMVLAPGRSVTIELQDSAGQPLTDWTVVLENSRATRLAPRGRAAGRTDGKGVVTLAGLPLSGLWNATVRSPEQQDRETWATRPVDLAADRHTLIVRAEGEREALGVLAKVQEATEAFRDRRRELAARIEANGPLSPVRIDLVDGSGKTLTHGDLGGWTARNIHARWADGDAGRSWSTTSDGWHPESPASLEIDVPQRRPLSLELAFGPSRWLVLAPAPREAVRLPVDLDELERTTAEVTFEGTDSDGQEAGPGWSIHIVETRSGAEYGSWRSPGDPDRAVAVRLPAGTYDYTAFEWSELTTGRFTVEDGVPRTLSIQFPGRGAAAGRLRSDFPVLGVKAISARGIGVRGRTGIVGAHVLPDGRFWLTDLIAGPTTLVARVITDGGVVSVVVAEDLDVEPGVINTFPTADLTEASLTGPRLRSRPDSPAGGCEVRQNGRPVHAGGVLPGEVLLLPSRAETELRILPPLIDQQPARVLTVQLPEESRTLDF